MRDLLGRLRAALTPHALLVIAAVFLLLCSMRIQWGNAAHLTELESRISAVLSQVRGAGRVQVIIHTQQAGASGFSARETGPQRVCGAVVLAQGADDPIVQMELIQAICALLDLPASAVSVVTGGG